MALTAIADGYETDGILGTDIDIDNSTFLSGSSAFKLPSGGADVALYTDWVPVGVGTWTGAPQRAVGYFVIRADDASANKDIKLEIEYTYNFSTVYTKTLFSGPVTATSDWYCRGQVFNWGFGVTWARAKITRPTDRDFNAWVDRIYLNDIPACFAADNKNSAQTFAATWTTIAAASIGLYDYASQIRLSAPDLIAEVPGNWIIGADVRIYEASHDAGDMFGVRLKLNSTLNGTTYRYGGAVTIHGAAFDSTAVEVMMSVTAESVWLDALDTVELQLIQYTNTGSLKGYVNPRYFATRVTAEY